MSELQLTPTGDLTRAMSWRRAGVHWLPRDMASALLHALAERNSAWQCGMLSEGRELLATIHAMACRSRVCMVAAPLWLSGTRVSACGTTSPLTLIELFASL